MKKGIGRYINWGLSVLVGIGVFLFWYVAYPHALSYQEQYQLFLWTWDYFVERVSLPGGFADWLGEFIVQFYYVEWLGALLLALLFVALQRLTLRLLTHGDSPRVSEPGACGNCLVADGRCQCIVVTTCGNRLGSGLGLYPVVETALMD